MPFFPKFVRDLFSGRRETKPKAAQQSAMPDPIEKVLQQVREEEAGGERHDTPPPAGEEVVKSRRAEAHAEVEITIVGQAREGKQRGWMNPRQEIADDCEGVKLLPEAVRLFLAEHAYSFREKLLVNILPKIKDVHALELVSELLLWSGGEKPHIADMKRRDIHTLAGLLRMIERGEEFPLSKTLQKAVYEHCALSALLYYFITIRSLTPSQISDADIACTLRRLLRFGCRSGAWNMLNPQNDAERPSAFNALEPCTLSVKTSGGIHTVTVAPTDQEGISHIGVWLSSEQDAPLKRNEPRCIGSTLALTHWLGAALPKTILFEAQARIGGFRSPSIVVFRDASDMLHFVDRGLTEPVRLTQGKQGGLYVPYPSSTVKVIRPPEVRP